VVACERGELVGRFLSWVLLFCEDRAG
jgi:hypothetical protein